MTASDRWARVKELFELAVGMPTATRDAAVTQAAAHDAPEVLAEVRALLRAHDAANAEPPPEHRRRSDSWSAEHDEDPTAATTVVGYHVEAQIGEGGFGIVYRAEQLVPIRRHVALKVLKAGMDSRQVLARFDGERQALARMEHPNIATVFDAGTTRAGRPFFAMELVLGQPITEHCDRAGLDTAARLELFQHVCGAVQHAHQKGVIHRDLKPSNVLVTVRGGVAVPKVIDFGIAKATEHPLTEHTLFTDARQSLGTPDYMAPEQHASGGLDVDTRADVYSLGVLLYELLTGSRPLDLATTLRGGHEAMLRQVREQEPPRPSQRVDTTARRRVLRGELDWIVMQALAKDRNRRYASAEALAADLERYLRRQPVQAGPPGIGYQTRKFVQRNRGAVFASALVLLSLVGGLVVSWSWYREARDAETRKGEALADERQARLEAQGHQLSAQAIALASEEPTTALYLAIEGARRAADEDANVALYTTLAGHHLLRELDGHDHLCERIATNTGCTAAISADITRLVLLWDLATFAVRCRIDVHEGDITALGFTADERLAFTASRDGTVRLWDSTDGAARGTLPHGAPLVWAGSRRAGGLLTLSEDGVLRDWDAAAAAAPATLHRFERRPVAADLSADGRRIGVITDDMVAWIVDRTTAAVVHRLPLSADPPPDLYGLQGRNTPQIAFAPAGNLLLTRDAAGHALVWDTQNGTFLRDLTPPLSFCGNVGWSPDGRLVFLLLRSIEVRSRHHARVVVAATDTTVMQVSGEDCDIDSTGTFSPDGRTLLTQLQPKTILWSVADGQRRGVLYADPHGLSPARFLPDGRQLLTGSNDGALYLWTMTPFPERHGIGSEPWSPGTSLRAVSPDGERAVVAALPGVRPLATTLVAASSGSALGTLTATAEADLDASFSPDGRRLAICPVDERGVRVLDANSLQTLFARGDAIYRDPRFNADGRRLTVRRNQQRVVFDLDQGTEVARIPSTSSLPARLSPDATVLLQADGAAGTISCWDVRTGQRTGVVEHRAFTFDAAISPDGRHLVTLGNDTQARVLDSATLAPITTCRIPTADYASVAFSPDGRLFAVKADTALVVFELPSGKPFARVRYRQTLLAADFTQDGQWLRLVDADGRIRLLPVDPLAYAEERRPAATPAAILRRYQLAEPAELARVEAAERAALGSAHRLVEAATTALQRSDLDEAEALLGRARSLRARALPRCHLVAAYVHAQRSAARAAGATGERLRREDQTAALAELRAYLTTGEARRDLLAGSTWLIPLRELAEFQTLLAGMR